MYEITVRGDVKLSKKEKKNIDFYADLDSQENFADYFDDTTYSNDVTSGYMRFEKVGSKLFTVTIYESERELTQEELDHLLDYTTGQWSDGIGEGFEQEPYYNNEDEEIYLSPWHVDQVATISQRFVEDE